MKHDIQLEIDVLAKRRDQLSVVVESLESVYHEKLGVFNRINEDIRNLVAKRNRESETNE